jgi:fucose permease
MAGLVTNEAVAGRHADAVGKTDAELSATTNGHDQEKHGDVALRNDIDERKLVRKLDLHLVPLVMALYLFSFLDRVNIGNARLYSLEADLGLVGNQYQIAVSILFVTYLAFEVPSNLVLKKFTPRLWIAFITTAWGIIATLTGLTRSYGSLIACRLLLGAVEAGLFPGLKWVACQPSQRAKC